mgnify:CR=1 FL=1
MSEKEKQNKKTAGNNQWTSTHQKNKPDTRERHDGPGGN